MIQHINIWCPEEDNLTNGAGNVQEKKKDTRKFLQYGKNKIHRLIDIKCSISNHTLEKLLSIKVKDRILSAENIRLASDFSVITFNARRQ